jgi:hypothetical protein
MQSIEYKRFPSQRIGIVVALAATLMIVLTAAGIVFANSDDGDGSARTIVHSPARTSPVYTDAFLEMNTNLPEVSDGRTVKAANGEPLELNVTPPGTLRPSVIDSSDILFLEMNTMLPGMTSPKIMSSDEMRFLEMNQLPDKNAPYLPSLDASQHGELQDF